MNSHAEYCAPVWCCGAHIRLIDPAINDALPLVTGCLRPTPADNLPILAGIQPAELRRNGATLFLACRALEPGHLLYSALARPSSANARRLKLRHLCVPNVQQLICLSDNLHVVDWRIANGTWSGWTTPHDSTRSSMTPAPTLWNDAPKNSLGPA